MPDIAELLQGILDRPLTPGEPLAIAVSGGPDSLALLHLAHATWPGRITALTVDHGLRRDAATEAASVAAQCAARGVTHVILRWIGPKPDADLQAAARTARYALMAEWCAAHGVCLLLSAHHADDQAETLLMRLARGSGGTGLSGIRRTRVLAGTVTLARPLLTVRRTALAEIAAAAGWQAVADPSNQDPRFARTHARRLLAATPWLDPVQMAQAAAHLGDVETALQWAEDRAWAGNAALRPGSVALDVTGLPAALVHRLVRRAICHLVPAATPRGPALATLIAGLADGRSATLAGVSATAGPSAGPWIFMAARPRRVTRTAAAE